MLHPKVLDDVGLTMLASFELKVASPVLKWHDQTALQQHQRL